MRNNLMVTLMNCLLWLLVFLSAGFTCLVIRREPEAATVSALALQDNNNLIKVNQILNDVAAYNATAHDPELANLLQTARQKPVGR